MNNPINLTEQGAAEVKYELRNAAGHVCCAADDSQRVCPAWSSRLKGKGSEVPAPASLATAIRTSRSAPHNTTPQGIQAPLTDRSRNVAVAAYFAAQARPVTDVTIARSAEVKGTVPPPPSLLAAIRQRGGVQ